MLFFLPIISIANHIIVGCFVAIWYYHPGYPPCDCCSSPPLPIRAIPHTSLQRTFHCFFLLLHKLLPVTSLWGVSWLFGTTTPGIHCLAVEAPFPTRGIPHTSLQRTFYGFYFCVLFCLHIANHIIVGCFVAIWCYHPGYPPSRCRCSLPHPGHSPYQSTADVSRLFFFSYCQSHHCGVFRGYLVLPPRVSTV